MPQGRDIPWDEWRRNQLYKAPSSGGRQSGLNPGLGMMGPTGQSASRAPTGPNYRPDGRPGSGKPEIALPSKYDSERQSQPSNWIDDVDMDQNWYSPFQPIWPYGPPSITRPREWNFPVGYNLNYIQPRMELMQMLRQMRGAWGVLATITTTRQDQLLRIPWTIQRRDKPKQRSSGVDEMRKFFRKPDQKLTYGQWSRKLLFDLFDIDAPSIYLPRDRRGRPLYAEVLDGATIFPLIDDAGRRPDSVLEEGPDGTYYSKRQPAFQQIIYGLPMLDLDETEIMYRPMRPQPAMPMFGYSPVEQIYNEVIEAILKTTYQRNFWQEGTIPDLIITVPDNWTPRQIAMFQGHFDALLAGNLNLKSKVRFIPGGMKPFDIKNSSGESLWSQRDEMLIRLACYAFSVSPTPFIHQTNRATAQNAQQTAEEEGLYPLMSWWKDDIMDPIIQDHHGMDDIEFLFLPRPEPDQEKQAKIHDLQLRNGSRTINEVRDELGEEPIADGDTPLIYVGNGAIPVDVAARGEAVGQGDSSAGGSSNSADDGDAPKDEARSPASQQRDSGNKPQGGTPRARNASTQPPPGNKLADLLSNHLNKVSNRDVRHAAAESEGDIDRVSHLVQHVGNYKKGHIWIQGLNISIENEKGSYRGEKDQHGKKWQVKMPTAYGYIRGTIGADGMQVDCYIGKHPESDLVFVIDQDKVSPKGANQGFDEHKVMIGYKKAKRAVKDWMKSHFEDFSHDKLRTVTELSMVDFKVWLKKGDMKAPISRQGVGTIVMNRKDLQKSDTISASTNLASYDQTSVAPKKRRKKKLKSGPRWLQLTAS